MNIQSIWVFLALSLFQLTSCTQDADVLISEKNEFVSENNLDELLAISSSPQRSKDEALAIARQFSTTSTRSNSMAKSQFSNDFEIDVVLADKTPKTYSTNSNEIVAVDTMLYVLNRKDNNGFFIISGDKRLPDLLGHSLEGHLDKDNVDDNSGFSVFLSRLPAYYQSTLDEFYARLDSLEALEQATEDDEPLTYRRRRRPRPARYRYEYSDWSEVSKSPVLVPVTWRQRHPFNDEAPLIDNQHALAGCVATATAQLLTAFKYPLSYERIAFDWDLLTKYSKYYSYSGEEYKVYSKQVAALLRKIGDKIGNSWGLEGTGARTERIPGLLREMGYRHTPGITSYDTDGIISSIAQNRPAILEGYSEHRKKGWFIFKRDVYSSGHDWIVDGFLRQERTVKKILKKTNAVVETKTESRILLHCNWGWNGSYNGYFNPGVFDSHSPMLSDPYTRSISLIENNKEGYFQYKVRNILHIHP